MRRLFVLVVEGCSQAGSGQLRSALYSCSQQRLRAGARGGRYQCNSERSQRRRGWWLCLALIGLSAEAPRIKQTDLNPGPSGPGEWLVSCISADRVSETLPRASCCCIGSVKPVLRRLLGSSQRSARFGDRHCEQMKRRCRKHLVRPSHGCS